MDDSCNNTVLEGENTEKLANTEQSKTKESTKTTTSVSTSVGTDSLSENSEKEKDSHNKNDQITEEHNSQPIKTSEISTDTDEDLKKDNFTEMEIKPKTYVDASTDTEEDLNVQTSKMILSITEDIIITLKLSITYFDNMTRTCSITVGDIVNIRAIQPVGQLNEFEGLVKSITKNKDDHYLICIDCAKDYKSEIVYVNTQSIRSVKKIIIPKKNKKEE